MELVYLWVEDYKNIQKQGFNFSPRFECSYDEVTNELTIDEKDDYVSIFPDNINVTAIVGENGSGKSSIVTLLEELDSFTCDLYPRYRKLKFILVFKKNNDFIQGYSSIKDIKSICNIKYVHILQESLDEFPNAKKKIFKNKYSRAMGRISYMNPCLFDKDFSFLTLFSEMPYPYQDERKIKIKKNKTINYESNNIANIAIKNASDNFIFELTTFMRYPKIIYLKDNEILQNTLIEELLHIEATYSDNPDCYDERKNLNPNNALEAFMINRIIKDANLCIDFFKVYSSINDEDKLQKFYDNEEYDLNEEDYNLLEYEKLISYVAYNIQEITLDINNLITKYDRFMLYDFQDDKNRKFSDLSHGEKSIYAQFVSIYDIVSNSDNSLIVLDEPDLSLHPTWQKNYVYELSNTFFKLNKKIHFILTMHSPFLLSDLPKENVIFLDKFDEETKKKYSNLNIDELKNGNCINVSKYIDVNPFGANIHTLLSHGFFMQDGLMGEFAKEKINEVIKILKRKTVSQKNLNYCEKIISIIGEPILQKTLEHKLNEKLLSKEVKLRKLQKQQEEINKEIESLKNETR